MTKERRLEIIKFMRHLAKCHDVKLHVGTKRKILGCFNIKKRSIYVHFYTDLLSTFFHELGHLEAVETGVYPSYYRFKPFTVDYAYRAECDADNRGKRLMKCYFPGMKYDSLYLSSPRDAKTFLKSYWGL